MPTLEAKQLGELGGGDVDRRPGLEAGHHRVGQEVGDVGEADLHRSPSHADGSDEEAHRSLLAGEDMLDRGTHLGFSIVGASDAPQHRPALGLLAVDLRTQETVGEILLVGL